MAHDKRHIRWCSPQIVSRPPSTWVHDTSGGGRGARPGGGTRAQVSRRWSASAGAGRSWAALVGFSRPVIATSFNWWCAGATTVPSAESRASAGFPSGVAAERPAEAGCLGKETREPLVHQLKLVATAGRLKPASVWKFCACVSRFALRSFRGGAAIEEPAPPPGRPFDRAGRSLAALL